MAKITAYKYFYDDPVEGLCRETYVMSEKMIIRISLQTFEMKLIRSATANPPALYQPGPETVELLQVLVDHCAKLLEQQEANQ